MSLAQLATAVRVREVLKRQAVSEINKAVPRPLVGRVVSVDLPRQKARVWFTGDEQPMDASLFSSTIPGKWQGQLEIGLTASTNVVGYGSMVSCQFLNGILYITDVLNGGQFSYDLTTMNQKWIATWPYSDSANSVFGQVIEAKMHVTIVSDISTGQSIEFGPFINTADSHSGDWVEIEMLTSTGTSSYKFNTSAHQFYDGSSNSLSRWFRLIPNHETSADQGDTTSHYDLDMCMKNTAYGVEPEFNQQSDEYWFRLIPRDAGTTSISANIAINTSLFDKPRSVDGNERLISTLVTIPPVITGYIGFHNSHMNVFDLFDLKVRDNFDRSLASTWGTASDGTTWTASGGSASNYTVASNKGTIAPATANTLYSQVNSRLEYDFDVVCKVSPSLTAAGDSHFAYVFVRRTASDNYYRFRLEFTTGGQVNIIIGKVVSGTSTTLQSATSAVAYTAGGSIWVRGQIRNSKLRMKVWASGSAEPSTWSLTHESDTAIVGAGASALAAFRATANTNTTLVTSFSELECNLSMQARFSEGKWSTGPWRGGLVRTAQDLQKTLTLSGGSFSFDGTYFGWTGEILLTGIGRNINGLSQGSMYVTCPKNATEYVIPVFGNSAPTTLAVNAAGIPLAAGRSLYVAIPPGERNVDLIENLFLVDSSVDGVEFHLPEWAVLIAHRQPGTDKVRLGCGEWGMSPTIFRVVGSTQSSNSTTYVSITGGSFSFTKYRSSTRLIARITGSSYVDVTGDKTEFALQINGTDYSITTYYHNAITNHDQWAGMNEITGIPAGTYASVLLRFRRISGSGVVRINNDDLFCVELVEAD